MGQYFCLGRDENRIVAFIWRLWTSLFRFDLMLMLRAMMDDVRRSGSTIGRHRAWGK